MEKTCPFWPDDRQCLSKECGIGYCDDEVPSGLKHQPAYQWFVLNSFELL
ncbi:hypothetical protein WUBG_10225 [Wuchereria bancrofti]|uniref:Uncharacterized protein n=1 Tax=Wuchereria bancrofti TaxID=6293 RepID=J9E9M7_WUCBA|nr:hypothetical protein WUBG_10225 [Wuchereria bancrofti]